MNLGFIGLGGYARNHLRAVEKNPDLRITAVCDPVPERAREVAERFGAREAADVADLAADPRVDGVVITTPNTLHFEHFRKCVKRGKHVFVNVPATTDREEAGEMVRLALRHGVVFMAGHNLRRNPAIVHLKDLLANGTLGTVHAAEASVCGNTGYTLTPENWRFGQETAPLLPFAQMGVVFLDLLLDFLGAPKRVAAFMAKRDGAGEAPDMGMATAWYADGRMSTLHCSYIAQSSYEITFLGSRGKARWDRLDDNSVTVTTDAGRERQVFERIDEQYGELVEFAECVATGRTPSVGPREVYRVAAYFDAIERSVVTRHAVPFDGALPELEKTP